VERYFATGYGRVISILFGAKVDEQIETWPDAANTSTKPENE